MSRPAGQGGRVASGSRAATLRLCLTEPPVVYLVGKYISTPVNNGDFKSSIATRASFRPKTPVQSLLARHSKTIVTVQPLTLFAKPGHESGAAPLLGANEFGTKFGLLPRQKIELMVRRKMI